MIGHDMVYTARLDGTIIGETDLATILFDTEYSSGANGIWSIAYIADNRRQAIHMARKLMHGDLPAGIRDHNDYTRQWRELRASEK